jgi:hypothetical protein
VNPTRRSDDLSKISNQLVDGKEGRQSNMEELGKATGGKGKLAILIGELE